MSQRDPIHRTGVLFDLDGTLVDSVYQHVLAWRAAFAAEGIDVAVWKIHRRIGMSGGLFARALLGETDIPVTAELAARLQDAHREAYRGLAGTVRRLPGSNELLAKLTELAVPWAIATSSGEVTAARTMEQLTMPAEVPVITRDRVQRAKPDPDLFLAAADALGLPIEDCVVVGDSVWDLLAARRARALGIGLLSGGYGQDELERAGAFRVYEDPADMLVHLHEIGIRETD
jgi:HAD superfamily hydrolase (TIGR01549 family)